jgi:hypothetical protein
MHHRKAHAKYKHGGNTSFVLQETNGGTWGMDARSDTKWRVEALIYIMQPKVRLKTFGQWNLVEHEGTKQQWSKAYFGENWRQEEQ